MDVSKNMINDLINKNKELFKVICSTHYPFTKEELKKYWDKINKGNAYYKAYMGDMDKYFFPEFGLCWNANVEWDEWLKGHWYHYDPNHQNKPKDIDDKISIGLWNPFDGCFCDGAYEVPLNITKEIFSRPSVPIEYYYEMKDLRNKTKFNKLKKEMEIEHDILSKEYDELSIETIASFLKNSRYKNLYKHLMITKRDIWDNTLSKWIDADIIKELFS